MIDANQESIIVLYYEYTASEQMGFNIESAQKVLKDSGIEIDGRETKIQFDLAQMAVLDEHLGAAEYSEMELVEFYEYLVRISYVAPNEDGSVSDAEKELAPEEIKDKLRNTLEKMLRLVGREFVEPVG
jgi:hypothetical protein